MNDTILRHMALAFFGSAYADQAEEAGQPLRGEIMDQLPEQVDDAAQQAATTLYAELERVNGKPVIELFDLLCEECDGEGDRPHTEEMFGHYAAMQAMGHGVGLDDAFGSKARELVTVPYVDFSSASLAEDYFTDESDDDDPMGGEVCDHCSDPLESGQIGLCDECQLAENDVDDDDDEAEAQQ